MHLNVTTTDTIYLLSGLIGLSLSLYALPHYHRSHRAARRVPDAKERRDALRINAGVFLREYVRLAIHCLTATSGILSLFITPQVVVYASRFDGIFGNLVIATLLVANLGTTLNTALVWREYLIVRERRILPGLSVLADLRRRIRRVE